MKSLFLKNTNDKKMSSTIRTMLTGLAWLFFLLFLIPKNVKSQTLPDFNIRLTNGKLISSKQLSSDKPTIIIVFSPDCGHCKILIAEIFRKIKNFKNTQIVMATFVPKNEITAFEKHYQTSRFPNVIVGTDVPALFFQRFYHLSSTPFTILYDKNKKMVVSYNNEKCVDNLIKRLRMLP